MILANIMQSSAHSSWTQTCDRRRTIFSSVFDLAFTHLNFAAQRYVNN